MRLPAHLYIYMIYNNIYDVYMFMYICIMYILCSMYVCNYVTWHSNSDVTI